MRKRMALLYVFTVFLWGENVQQNVNEKLILAYSTEQQVAEENLLALTLYFRENQYTQTLKEKNNLHFALETLGDYHMTVIYPVKSVALRNELLLTLSPIFKDMFSIHSEKEYALSENTQQTTNLPAKVKIQKTQASTEQTLGLQWLVLLLFAAVGLFLSIRNRRKILHIKQGQEDMHNTQEKIQTEINTLGGKNA